MSKAIFIQGARGAETACWRRCWRRRNFTSSDHGIEAKSGWANVLSTERNYAEITEKLGRTYEVSLNTYKPFAVQRVVMHPAIDGCIQLRSQYKLTADQIEHIELRVHPLVLELTGKKTPEKGLDGKFSIYYATAVSIVDGARRESEQFFRRGGAQQVRHCCTARRGFRQLLIQRYQRLTRCALRSR